MTDEVITQTLTPRALGRIPDKDDARDKLFSAKRARALLQVSVPKRLDLRKGHYPIRDQGGLGSCVGHGAIGGFRKVLRKQKVPDHHGSTLAAYYFARELDGSVRHDVGATIRNGMKGLTKRGAPHEGFWPYIESRFDELPSATALADGLKHLGLEYQRVDSTRRADCKAALALNGNLVIGIAVYESFMDPPKSGRIPMPEPGEQLLGYHCVDTAGYTEASLIIANSWSPHWAKDGFAFLPWKFVENIELASDFWSWTQVVNGGA